jgi:hypothetical protein
VDRDARVQADVVSIAPDVAGFVDDLRVKTTSSSTKAMSCSSSIEAPRPRPTDGTVAASGKMGAPDTSGES